MCFTDLWMLYVLYTSIGCVKIIACHIRFVMRLPVVVNFVDHPEYHRSVVSGLVAYFRRIFQCSVMPYFVHSFGSVVVDAVDAVDAVPVAVGH